MRKVMVGTVVSDGMDKTVVVTVKRLTKHPAYNRVIRKRSRFKAHDESNEAHVGDKVKIVESRPVSRTKHWRLLEILEKAEGK